MEQQSPTIAHKDPERPAESDLRRVLVAAFPRPAVLALPRSGEAVGRAWLEEASLADAEVSGEHLCFHRSGGVVRVEDLGSRNGTWALGQRLPPRRKVPIDDGAVLRLGTTLLVYREAFSGPDQPDEPLAELAGPFGLRGVRAAIDAVCRSAPANVLIEGETGTGKELVAQALARALGRPSPFAAVNTAGVAAGVFESQLFGHQKGAFSDAREATRGIIMAHDGGTVFLDEIGELPLPLQPKLLRLLENREVLAVGSERAQNADVLLLAATNRSLADMVERGEFRRDLWARLALATVKLPALRERVEDLFAIVRALAERRGRPLPEAEVEVEAVERLMLHDWPNNVREVDSVTSDCLARDPKGGLKLWAVEAALGPSAATPAPLLTLDNVERALQACDGNETRAARMLGVTRGKLRRFLQRDDDID